MEHFCTCRDYKCRLNPINHDKGCDPCIKKNLAKGEIPTCFFIMADEDLSGVESYSLDGFIKHCEKARNKKQ